MPARTAPDPIEVEGMNQRIVLTVAALGIAACVATQIYFSHSRKMEAMSLLTREGVSPEVQLQIAKGLSASLGERSNIEVALVNLSTVLVKLIP